LSKNGHGRSEEQRDCGENGKTFETHDCQDLIGLKAIGP